MPKDPKTLVEELNQLEEDHANSMSIEEFAYRAEFTENAKTIVDTDLENELVQYLDLLRPHISQGTNAEAVLLEAEEYLGVFDQKLPEPPTTKVQSQDTEAQRRAVENGRASEC